MQCISPKQLTFPRTSEATRPGLKIAAPRDQAKESPKMRPLLAQNASRSEWSCVLTARQQEIVALICRGLSNKEIARELRLSEGTAKMHVHNILEKTGFRSRTEIIFAATRLTA
jgi:DNA-binding NarL/FixJ family response regulator